MSVQFAPERPALKLSVQRFCHVTRGIRVIGTWLMSGSREPCLVLTNANIDLRSERLIPCVIPLSSAHRWTVEFGDPRHCARNVMAWLTVGALPGSPHDAKAHRAVFDAVQSRLTDLIHMPPAPFLGREIAGDITFTNRTTGEVIERDIIEDV